MNYSPPEAFQAKDIEANNAIAPIQQRWHPKITPYRLIVLVTPIAICSWKAVSYQRGSTSTAITLEWISGTVLFLLLFSVSSYDSEIARSKHPLYLSWLFDPDCMDLCWRILAKFSVRRPSYISTERHAHVPIVTGYRIFVCSVVISLGLFKAVLGYFRLAPAVNWLDWVLAVPVTTIIYCISLYEYNTSNLWPSLFSADYSDELTYVNGKAMYTVLACGPSSWIAICTYLLVLLRSSMTQEFSNISRDEKGSVTMSTLFSNYSVMSISADLFGSSILLAMISIGILGLRWIAGRVFISVKRERYIPFLFRVCHNIALLLSSLSMVLTALGVASWIAVQCVGLTVLENASIMSSAFFFIFMILAVLVIVLASIYSLLCFCALLGYTIFAIFILLVAPWRQNAGTLYSKLPAMLS